MDTLPYERCPCWPNQMASTACFPDEVVAASRGPGDRLCASCPDLQNDLPASVASFPDWVHRRTSCSCQPGVRTRALAPLQDRQPERLAAPAPTGNEASHFWRLKDATKWNLRTMYAGQRLRHNRYSNCLMSQKPAAWIIFKDQIVDILLVKETGQEPSLRWWIDDATQNGRVLKHWIYLRWDKRYLAGVNIAKIGSFCAPDQSGTNLFKNFLIQTPWVTWDNNQLFVIFWAR